MRGDSWWQNNFIVSNMIVPSFNRLLSLAIRQNRLLCCRLLDFVRLHIYICTLFPCSPLYSFLSLTQIKGYKKVVSLLLSFLDEMPSIISNDVCNSMFLSLTAINFADAIHTLYISSFTTSEFRAILYSKSLDFQ